MVIYVFWSMVSTKSPLFPFVYTDAVLDDIIQARWGVFFRMSSCPVSLLVVIVRLPRPGYVVKLRPDPGMS